MSAQKPTTAIFIDKYHPKANGLCSVSIRVTFNRKKKYYPTPISITLEDFEKIQSPKPRNGFKEISLKLQSYEKRAADIIEELQIFSWLSFEKKYLSNKAFSNSINEAFNIFSERLRQNEQIGTAVSYECAQRSLFNYESEATFADVTPEFLKKYEKWMLDNGKSVTTINIYLRSLRSIFNDAISDGLISKELYPFGKKKYELPTSNNIKKALSLKDIAAIYYYKAKEGSNAEMARDFWLFIYLCNGMNMKDLCLLKFANIKGDVLEYERAKTARTKRKVEPIRVALVEDAMKIIEKWGNKNKTPENYIFPVLTKENSAVRQRQLIQQITHLVNDHMKEIAKSLNITNDVTTYAARHSFATILQRSGVSIAFIGEALGHSNIKTTQNYLAGFEDESKKEMVKALTAFKK